MNSADNSFKVNNDVKIAALLVATIASSFFTPFMGTSVNIALPTIGLVGADAIVLNWITNGFLLAAAIFAVPFGRLRIYMG